MNCQNVREEIVERLVRGGAGGASPGAESERDRAMDEHLVACDGCRAEAERLRALWGELGRLTAPVAATPSGGEARLARLIHGRNSSGTANQPRRLTPVVLSLAATLILGFALGRWFDARAEQSPAGDRTVAVAPASDTGAQFVLLLHGPAATPGAPAPSAAEIHALVAEYGQWAERLRQAGALVSAEKLSDEPFQVVTGDGAHAPSRGAADELGGFFVIRAADAAEAHRIARESPHLKYGGTIQVRRIEPT